MQHVGNWLPKPIVGKSSCQGEVRGFEPWGHTGFGLQGLGYRGGGIWVQGVKGLRLGL